MVFEKLLIESLEKFIRREAQERSLASAGEDDSDFEDDYSSSQVLAAPSGSAHSLATPLLSAYIDTIQPLGGAHTSEEVKSEVPSTSRTDPKQTLEQELSFLKKARESGMVYLLGHGDIRAKKDSWFIKKLAINYFYAFLRKNSRRGIANFTVPHQQLIQVSMTYMV